MFTSEFMLALMQDQWLHLDRVSSVLSRTNVGITVTNYPSNGKRKDTVVRDSE